MAVKVDWFQYALDCFRKEVDGYRRIESMMLGLSGPRTKAYVESAARVAMLNELERTVVGVWPQYQAFAEERIAASEASDESQA